MVPMDLYHHYELVKMCYGQINPIHDVFLWLGTSCHYTLFLVDYSAILKGPLGDNGLN